MMVGGSGGGSEEPDWSIEQVMIQIQQLVNNVMALQNTIHQQNAIIQQLQAQQPAGNMGALPASNKAERAEETTESAGHASTL
ncbi:hypothetical protein AMATHDRAFT_11446, partial [Amanita thiersii Skay4041]